MAQLCKLVQTSDVRFALVILIEAHRVVPFLLLELNCTIVALPHLVFCFVTNR